MTFTRRELEIIANALKELAEYVVEPEAQQKVREKVEALYTESIFEVL